MNKKQEQGRNGELFRWGGLNAREARLLLQCPSCPPRCGKAGTRFPQAEKSREQTPSGLPALVCLG